MFLVRDLVSPRTWLALISHLAGLFIGLAAFIVAVVGFALGLGLIPLALIGLPVFGMTLRFAEGLAWLERARFGFLLDTQIESWPAEARAGLYWREVVAKPNAMTKRVTLAEAGYALLRFPISLVMTVISSELVSFGRNGRMVRGASVWPMKMLAATFSDSAPLAPIMTVITHAAARITICMTPM